MAETPLSCPLPVVIRESLIVTSLAVTTIVPLVRSMFEIVCPAVLAEMFPLFGVSTGPVGSPELVESG